MPLPTNTSGPHVVLHTKKCGQIAMKVKKIAYSTLLSTTKNIQLLLSSKIDVLMMLIIIILIAGILSQ